MTSRFRPHDAQSRVVRLRATPRPGADKQPHRAARGPRCRRPPRLRWRPSSSRDSGHAGLSRGWCYSCSGTAHYSCSPTPTVFWRARDGASCT